jgi:putative SOS response-associated peptidase YedK
MCYSVFVKQDLEYLIKNFGAQPANDAFANYSELSKENPKKFKNMVENPRIYPGYYAPIIFSDRGKKFSYPMRYRVRPEGSEKEVPSKYNLFNARSDSLLNRKTWKHIFMRNHGIVVFDKFFEWVVDNNTGKKKVVSFSPNNHEVMWAPVLYDVWLPPKNNGAGSSEPQIHSFAIITKEPPKEVLEHGHDRCPVFLKKDSIDYWLNPEGKSSSEMIKVLQTVEDTYFECFDAVP